MRARRGPARHCAPTSSVATRASAAAALGAVTTGAFTALIPTIEAPAKAQADEPVEAALAAVSVPLPVTDDQSDKHHKGSFLPVRTPAADNALNDGQLAQLGKAADIATHIAQLHAKQAEQSKIDALVARGGLDGWIAKALQIMDLPQNLAPGIKSIIMRESNGNPYAINRWDANARRGTPSQGLMQTIPSTFRKYVHPSLAHLSITDPIANITAGVRYMIANYGIKTLQQGGRRSASGAYLGY